MKARWPFALAIVLFAVGLARDKVEDWVDATVLPDLIPEVSAEVLDRNGALLRAYTVADGRWRLAVQLDQVDPDYIAMLLRYEDKRFYEHGGVDGRAMLRAVGQAIWQGEVHSGASTLTMQVARLLEESGTGQWEGKLRQIRVALAMERELSKDQILALYLNLAPFGGNIEGVRAASLRYFGKEPARLSEAEAALLIALPQSPEARRPDRDVARALDARDGVLERLFGLGLFEREAYESAQTETIPAQIHEFPALAAHLSDRVLGAEPLRTTHVTTLDRDLQIQLEALAGRAVAAQGARVSIAMIVADHESGEILASIGSAGYRADERQGFVDMTRALRSPGSTLKPLIYGLAFDEGLAHPETIIADRPVRFGTYAPQNFDGQFRGELRVRQALQLSLNIPVVSLTEALGPPHVIAGLRRAGVRPVVPGGRPGLAVSLGGVGVTLEDLVQLYAAIARGGESVDLHWGSDAPDARARRVIGAAAAWHLGDILREVPRPHGVLGQGIAFKTGTSYGHRDAWAIGFDGTHVIGVWMGRPDGTPVPGAFGGELAAPILFQAFERLKPEITPLAPPPPETLMVGTALLPLPLQRFDAPTAAQAQGGPEITFPPNGALLETDFGLMAKVRDGIAPFTWLANGRPILTSNDREVALPELGPGFAALVVIDAEGRAATSRIELR